MEQRVKARRLQRRVEYYVLQAQPDGFGGSTVERTKIAEWWADIRSISSSSAARANIAVMGVTDFTELYKVTVRSRAEWDNAKTYELKFGNNFYEVLSVQNIDQRGTRTELTIRKYPE